MSWRYKQPDHPESEEVAKENNGYALADLYDQNGTLLAKKANCSIASRCCAMTAAPRRLAGSIPAAGPSRVTRWRIVITPILRAGQYAGMGWAWPLNRRVLYNRASADINGKPWDAKRMLIQWNGSKWVGNDIPDFNTAPPGSKPGRLSCSRRLGRLFALDKLAEGLFPALRADGNPAWH